MGHKWEESDVRRNAGSETCSTPRTVEDLKNESLLERFVFCESLMFQLLSAVKCFFLFVCFPWACGRVTPWVFAK